MLGLLRQSSQVQEKKKERGWPDKSSNTKLHGTENGICEVEFLVLPMSPLESL